MFQAIVCIDEVSLRLDLAYGKWRDVGTKRLQRPIGCVIPTINAKVRDAVTRSCRA